MRIRGALFSNFAGETFAMDPGTCEYANPLSHLLSNCERHNTLVPFGTDERPHPDNPPAEDIRPIGSGDECSFHATMNVTAGWDGYYKAWVREWESPAPCTLVIRDTYELARGAGVEFYWHTQRDTTRASGQYYYDSIVADRNSAGAESEAMFV